MRKIHLINALIGASLLSVGTMATAANVPGGTVHFKGEIVNAACAVSADSSDQTVNLGQYRTANFKAAGTHSGPVAFQIKLQDCDIKVATKASVAFTGPVDATDKTLLAAGNVGGGSSGVATGVGIEISDNTGAVLEPTGATFSAPLTLNDNNNVLNFTARYKSTAAAVTAGRADADATFTMKYE